MGLQIGQPKWVRMIHLFCGNAIVDQYVDDVLQSKVSGTVGLDSGSMQYECRPNLGFKWAGRVSAIMLLNGLAVSTRERQ